MTGLAGRQVLVTGGGSGLGRDMALAFAAAGARVVVAGRRAAALRDVAAQHPAITAIPADVTDEASLRALFAAAGRCQIVIANAGASASAPLLRTSLEDWRAMLDVNLTGAYLTLREGLRQMEGWGRLIAVASTAGLEGYAYAAPYVAAKHGVVGLVRAIAAELAGSGVTANALCPGFLDTPMTDRNAAAIAARTGRSPDQARAALAALNPHGRLIPPRAVTAVALRLCGPGGDGINGQALTIPGDER